MSPRVFQRLRVRISSYKGWYPNDGSTRTKILAFVIFVIPFAALPSATAGAPSAGRLDLLEDEGSLDTYVQVYQQIGYQVVQSVEDLLPLLTGKITVFMGQTGVGKSTLLNKIAPDLQLETGEISL